VHGDVLARQVSEVVAGTEVLSRGPDDEHLHVAACRDARETAVHLLEHGDGEGVLPRRAVERDDPHGVRFFVRDVPIFHAPASLRDPSVAAGPP